MSIPVVAVQPMSDFVFDDLAAEVRRAESEAKKESDVRQQQKATETKAAAEDRRVRFNLD